VKLVDEILFPTKADVKAFCGNLPENVYQTHFNGFLKIKEGGDYKF
jgi:hypothetical protein